jgi:hypothetical protein
MDPNPVQEPIQEAQNPPINQLHNNNQQLFNIVSAREIKILKNLNHNNICECENLIKATNANQVTLPLISWINLDVQFIIEQTMIAENVEDYQNWISKPYLEWLFPTLKQLFPESNKLTIFQICIR